MPSQILGWEQNSAWRLLECVSVLPDTGDSNLKILKSTDWKSFQVFNNQSLFRNLYIFYTNVRKVVHSNTQQHLVITCSGVRVDILTNKSTPTCLSETLVEKVGKHRARPSSGKMRWQSRISIPLNYDWDCGHELKIFEDDRAKSRQFQAQRKMTKLARLGQV